MPAAAASLPTGASRVGPHEPHSLATAINSPGCHQLPISPSPPQPLRSPHHPTSVAPTPPSPSLCGAPVCHDNPGVQQASVSPSNGALRRCRDRLEPAVQPPSLWGCIPRWHPWRLAWAAVAHRGVAMRELRRRRHQAAARRRRSHCWGRSADAPLGAGGPAAATVMVTAAPQVQAWAAAAAPAALVGTTATPAGGTTTQRRHGGAAVIPVAEAPCRRPLRLVTHRRSCRMCRSRRGAREHDGGPRGSGREGRGV